jgi:hypothetical protein
MRSALVVLIAVCGFAWSASSAAAAPGDPLFLFAPVPPAPPGTPQPPPNGFFNDPCGLTVDASGHFWVSDYYHRAISYYNPNPPSIPPLPPQYFEAQPLASFSAPAPHTGPVDDPCGLALDSTGTLYVNNYHRNVARFPAPLSLGTGTVLPGSGQATGVAVDPATDDVYVAKRDAVSVYEPDGTHTVDIGVGDLVDAYGVAVSGYGPTAGYVYVPDASDETIRVYDPATSLVSPVEVIDGSGTPNGKFISLRNAAVAVDDASGKVYVTDDQNPERTESPLSTVYVFNSTGGYLGHLKRNVFGGAPNGLAVDNSGTGTQGRVYVTTGNTHHSGVYAYAPNQEQTSQPLPPTIPDPPLGSGLLFKTVPIGGAAGASSGCEGDGCQALPPEPGDPTLTTLLEGLGNPKVRYRNSLQNCRIIAKELHRLNAKVRHLSAMAKRAKDAGQKRALEGSIRELRRRADRKARGAKACQAASGSSFAGASASATSRAAAHSSRSSTEPPAPPTIGGASTRGLKAGSEGFDAEVYADGGGVATLAGSHPYEVDMSVALDQSGGNSDLHDLRLQLPPGMQLNPANGTGVLCSSSEFTTPRTPPFPSGSESGESCHERSQVGTVEVTSGIGGGQTRTFGLYSLQPEAGVAARFGASPFGHPLVFDSRINADVPGTYVDLRADEIPQSLQLRGLKVSLWGVPWDASHNNERGDCLNEEEPAFALAKCTVGEPITTKPRAFVTLPTVCGASLTFDAEAASWQQAGVDGATTTSGGPITDCGALNLDLESEGLLSVTKASSASGFVFRFFNENEGYANPRERTQALVKDLTVQLPKGVSLNPSVGAGLGVCTPAQLAQETAFNNPGAGCPNASKIGDFIVGLPYFQNRLRGSIYLAQPDDPATSAPGAENPFDSLLAAYLVAKSADRGLLFRIPGKLTPDPGDGTITATFDDLPQLPYTHLEVNFRSGQRAPVVSPPSCGPASTKITLSSWSAGVPDGVSSTNTAIASGIEAGPCPNGSTPPFNPEAVTGGVNSNVGSYTPYYVRLTRHDTDQEITSYSLILPKGITGKLAGIPFCPEAAIAAARVNRGFAETANPSCPAASQVGTTNTGFGVGKALTYSPGRIYLAGPYNGQPLSLVTINAATVGPFDLGTIVIRSAFSVNPRTAQLQIDSGSSDPIPHILDGIPLHLREVRIYMDRNRFTRNPTSCEPSEMISTLTGSGASFEDPSDDSSATVSRHFQLLNCLELGFRPNLGLRLIGSTRRNGHPALRAVLRARDGDASMKRITVDMPKALFLAQDHIREICTRVQFEAEQCPEESIYGSAIVHSSLFDVPLEGPVFLRSSGNKLPDLVALLHSGAVKIVLEGRIGPTGSGGIEAYFDNVPDAPIEAFVMQLNGGSRGLLANSVDICKFPPTASVKALGQNNRGTIYTTKLRGKCKKPKAKEKRR